MIIIENYIEFGKTLKGADVYFRESWECYYFDLLGKCFGMMTEERITIKWLPEDNEKLRALHSDVTPGYYANKKHWNTISLDTDQLTEDEIIDFIHESYKLVYDKLPKKDRVIVDEMPGEE